MIYFFAKRKDSRTEVLKAYEYYDFPYNVISKKQMFEDFSTLDIETTSVVKNDEKYGFMYIWQMCVCGIVVYGRTYDSLFAFLQKIETLYDISKNQNHVIYIHNLAFEFQFLVQFINKYYDDMRVFSLDRRNPLKVSFGGFELRCSYKLTNMSLARFTETEYYSAYIKAKGDLDYRIYRDSKTPLTDVERTYIFMDVIALYHAIHSLMRSEKDTIRTIPMTSTGYVRRDCKRACKKSKSYMRLYHKQSLTEDVYKMLKAAGRGGDTSTNYRFAGEEIANVDSFDVASSYPFQLCCRKFPMSRFHLYGDVESVEELEGLLEKRALLFNVFFHSLRMKKDTTCLYLPISKALYYKKNERHKRTKNVRIANGRVMYAKEISYTITDIDWRIIKDCYVWDSVEIGHCYTAKYAYLPTEILDVIMHYFKQKCVFKEEIESLEELEEKGSIIDEQKERLSLVSYLYVKSKNKLNAIFGMCYTDPVRENIVFDISSDTWWKAEEDDIAVSLEKTKKNNNSFLVYAWGVWTTAHAREHLHNLRKLTGEGTIYWDTDSSKAIDVDISLIEKANKEIRVLCDERHAYVQTDKKRYYLGVYEHETKNGKYHIFKTLGSKKYAYTDHKGKIHLTISGVSKEHGATELGSIDRFKPGFTFKKAGGVEIVYNDCPIHKIDTPHGKLTNGANICVKESTYTIGISKEFAEIIDYNAYYN